MNDWLKPKTKLEKLEKKYAELMKRSFELAVREPKKSRQAKQEAESVFLEIQLLNFKKTGCL